MATLPCPPILSIPTTLEVPKLDAHLKNPHLFDTVSVPHNYQTAAAASVQVEDNSKAPKRLDFKEAFSLFVDGGDVKVGIYIPILDEFLKRKSIFELQALHSHLIRTGFDQKLILATGILSGYSKCGRTEDARKVFDNMPERSVVTWTALLTGYNQNYRPESGARLFIKLLESGVYPTSYTFAGVLSSCIGLNDVNLGSQIHGFIAKYGIEDDTDVGNTLCNFYAKCGTVETAMVVFKRIPEKNVISWTTMISVLGDNDEPESGIQIFGEMISDGVMPNDFTLTSVLSCCCLIHALHTGKQIHGLAIKTGMDSDELVKNSIMYMYLRCGEIGESCLISADMNTMNKITLNQIIAGHVQMMDRAKDDLLAHHYGLEALGVFVKMNRSPMKPDLFTLSSLLTVCSNLVALEQGEQIHAQSIKTGYASDTGVGTSLVNMYTKCGSIEKATKAFVEMPVRTIISWTSMITGFALHGRSKEALDLFENMRLCGVMPNKITFVGVLSACSRAGLVEEGLHYFEMMKRDYGIKPVIDHYACIIDMLVRAGELQRAFDFMAEMKVEPNEVIWSILLSSCRSQKKMEELSYMAAEKLLELKPKDPETYFMLSNMYIQSGRWKDLSRVRKIMKEERINKVQDWSWISIKDKVITFKANNDQAHLQSTNIQALLENLLEKAHTMGYVAESNVEASIEDDEDHKVINSDEGNKVMKMVGVNHHSVKLAVVFGLLNTLDGIPIRIVKRLRMCRDCHISMKLFSTITQREIIVRDGKRLHRFRDGECSCGEYRNFVS